jgi:hypothetical protein
MRRTPVVKVAVGVCSCVAPKSKPTPTASSDPTYVAKTIMMDGADVNSASAVVSLEDAHDMIQIIDEDGGWVYVHQLTHGRAGVAHYFLRIERAYVLPSGMG